MKGSIEHIAATLRQARKAKGFSQRELASRAGITQAQISKIERGEVNLAAETLIQVTRALDLELMLIPRQIVPAVNLIQNAQDMAAAIRKVSAARNAQAHALPRPAYSLENNEEGENND